MLVESVVIWLMKLIMSALGNFESDDDYNDSDDDYNDSDDDDINIMF